MILSSSKITQFLTKNKFSLARIEVIVQNLYSGSLHRHQVDELATLLHITRANLLRKLNKLVKTGDLKHPTNNWWHTVSWRKQLKCRKKLSASGNWAYGSYEIYDAKHDRWYSNKVYTLDLQKLISDPTYLRTFCYSVKIKQAHKQAQRNRTKSKSKNVKQNKALRTVNFEALSLSFIKNLTGLKCSVTTLSKQLHRAAKHKLVKVLPQWETIHTSTKSSCIEFIHYNIEPEDRRMYKISRVSKGQYELRKIQTNLIKVLF